METKRGSNAPTGGATRLEKSERTNKEARSVIDAESRARTMKTAKLKALRLAKEAADVAAKASEPPAPVKRRRAVKPVADPS